MNRNLVFGTLVLAFCGSAAWLTGWLVGRAYLPRSRESGRAAERRAWRRLWLPFAPAAVALAALVGWAIQEPRSTDELLRPFAWPFVLPPALIWLRASIRAALALRRPRVLPVAATIGILRPRVVLQPSLRERLDHDAFEAAVAHERAHARHLDPLRIWLAQISTDLQWPNVAATRRFADWKVALELARDEEARAGGVRGEDLADALIAAIRLSREVVPCAAAGLTGPERSLTERIYRLLSPLPEGPLVRHGLVAFALFTALAAALTFGIARGDLFVRALPLIAN
jgi:Zn-dependent protease with chaperone function